MSRKAYRLGLLVGRFQTVHLGHAQMISKALELCGRVGIFVGSSQESGTEQNPFSYEVREGLLKKLFGDRVEVYPLPDIGVGNNAEWGKYVLSAALERFGEIPDLFVTGRETRRVDWFDCPEGAGMAQLYVPKTIEISASEMRRYLTENDRASWERNTDPLLWEEYEQLRELALASAGNTETDSI